MAITKFMSAKMVVALALATIVLAVNEAPGRPTSGPPTRNFTIAAGQVLEWNESFDGQPSVVHVQFRQFTNMKLEIFLNGVPTPYVSDNVAGGYYTCRFSLPSTAGRTHTIRLTNRGGGTYSGVLSIR